MEDNLFSRMQAGLSSSALFGDELDDDLDPAQYGFDPLTRLRMLASIRSPATPPLQSGGQGAGGSFNPMQMLGQYNQISDMFGGGGGTAAGGGTAGGAEGGGMSAIASNPWAWLGAAVVGNEVYQKEHGNREDDPLKYALDLFDGKVLEQDADRYLANNKFGKMGKGLVSMGNPRGLYENVSNAGNWIKGLFD